jgi:hypothetical protein
MNGVVGMLLRQGKQHYAHDAASQFFVFAGEALQSEGVLGLFPKSGATECAMKCILRLPPDAPEHHKLYKLIVDLAAIFSWEACQEGTSILRGLVFPVACLTGKQLDNNILLADVGLMEKACRVVWDLIRAIHSEPRKNEIIGLLRFAGRLMAKHCASKEIITSCLSFLKLVRSQHLRNGLPVLFGTQYVELAVGVVYGMDAQFDDEELQEELCAYLNYLLHIPDDMLYGKIFEAKGHHVALDVATKYQRNPTIFQLAGTSALALTRFGSDRGSNKSRPKRPNTATPTSKVSQA